MRPGHLGKAHSVQVAGHDDVRKQHVYARLVRSRQPGKGRLGIIRHVDGVAQLFEHRAHDIPHLCIVVDQQYSGGPFHRPRYPVFQFVNFDVLVCERQKQGDAGALVDFAVNRYRSMGLPGETVYLRQAEAGSFANRLGREEGFERPLADLLAHPAAGIRDLQPDA